MKYLNLIYKIIIYFNALFGAGIIIFYISPLNEIINSFINYISFYNDNIFIVKFKDFLGFIKKTLDYFSDWIVNILNKDTIPDSFSAQEKQEVIKENIKVENFNNENDYKYLKRKEYYQTENIKDFNDNNFSWIKYTLIISGVIIILGITYYNWDSILTYFSSNNSKPSGDTPLNDFSNNNSTSTSPTRESNYFKSPESSTASSPSGSKTIIPNSPEPLSPEPLKIKLNNFDKYNPSYPNPDFLTETMVDYYNKRNL